MQLSYIPWMFDSKEAWELAVQDSRYHYNLPMNDFMYLYQEHRAKLDPSKTAPVQQTIVAPTPTPVAESQQAAPADPSGGGASELLDQNEIDALIAAL